MSAVTFALTMLNLVAFSSLATYFVVAGFRSTNRDIRLLAPVLAAFALLLMSGSSQRIVLQAIRFGWTHHLFDMVIGSWTQLQVLGVIAVATSALVVFIRVCRRVERVKPMTDVLGGRVRSLLPDSLDLTPRELEVVQVIGLGTIADDAIAQRLSISPTTAATHIRNVMAKTGVHDRRDLVLLDSILIEREQLQLTP